MEIMFPAGCIISITFPIGHIIPIIHRWFVVVVLFVARGAAAGFFQTVYVYTPEVYPTKLRALAMGTHREAIQ